MTTEPSQRPDYVAQKAPITRCDLLENYLLSSYPRNSSDREKLMESGYNERLWKEVECINVCKYMCLYIYIYIYICVMYTRVHVMCTIYTHRDFHWRLRQMALVVWMRT